MAVLKIEDGVVAVGVVVVAGGEIDDEVAWIGKMGTFELQMQAQAGMLGRVGRGCRDGSACRE